VRYGNADRSTSPAAGAATGGLHGAGGGDGMQVRELFQSQSQSQSRPGTSQYNAAASALLENSQSQMLTTGGMSSTAGVSLSQLAYGLGATEPAAGIPYQHSAKFGSASASAGAAPDDEINGLHTQSIDDSIRYDAEADDAGSLLADNTRVLMAAIELEKISLGTIPRMQPEKVLSYTHLEQLGKGQISIDTIATQLRWAKEKQLRQSQELQLQRENEKLRPRLQTSQSLGELNALTSMLGPPGGVGLQLNQFTDLDSEMGFKPGTPYNTSQGQMQSSPEMEAAGAGGGGFLSRQNSMLTSPSSPTAAAAAAAMKAKAKAKDGRGPSEAVTAEQLMLSKKMDAILSAPPKQLKTRAGVDTSTALPIMPYKSFEERMMVTNCGVAAGAGLSMMSAENRAERIRTWGPRSKSRQGRYKTGGTSHFDQRGFSPDRADLVLEKRSKMSMIP
jgi:hypothetical protein